MDRIQAFADALTQTGLTPEVIPDPVHIAVPFSGQSIDDEPVLRINLLDSVDDDLELWEMVLVIPARAVSEAAFDLATAMLGTINQSLTIGKMIPVADQDMLYFTYSHLTDTHSGVLQTGPAVVDLVLQNLTILSPALCHLLETDPPQSDPGFDRLEAQLTETSKILEDLVDQIQSPR